MDYIPVPSKWDLNKLEDRLQLNAIDLGLNFCLFTPLVVLHYHSTSAILDATFVQTFPRLGPFMLLCMGVGLEFAFAYYQQRIRKYVPKGSPEQQDLIHAISTRLYNFFLTFANICHVKAVADVYDLLVGSTTGSGIRAATTGLLILWGMRAGRNILSVPLGLSLDKADSDFYKFSTMFNTQVSH